MIYSGNYYNEVNAYQVTVGKPYNNRIQETYCPKTLTKYHI